MRRSRLVARKFAATKAGVADDSYDVVLVSLDIKDAFGYCTCSICFSRIYIFDLVAHFGSRTYVWRNWTFVYPPPISLSRCAAFEWCTLWNFTAPKSLERWIVLVICCHASLHISMSAVRGTQTPVVRFWMQSLFFLLLAVALSLLRSFALFGTSAFNTVWWFDPSDVNPIHLSCCFKDSIFQHQEKGESSVRCWLVNASACTFTFQCFCVHLRKCSQM